MTDPNHLPYRPCVGAMIVNADGLVLIAQRIEQIVEAWQMPQGGIDAGEDPLPAVLRELNEEIGVAPHHLALLGEHPDWLVYDLPPALLGVAWKGRYRGQRMKWFAFRFVGTDRDICIETAHPEFKAWRWAPLDSLEGLAVGFKQPVYRQLAADFAGYAVPATPGADSRG